VMEVGKSGWCWVGGGGVVGVNLYEKDGFFAAEFIVETDRSGVGGPTVDFPVMGGVVVCWVEVSGAVMGDVLMEML
jgi:hypothetical protein